MSRTSGATIVFVGLVAVAAFPGAARAECYLENVASAQEIAGGWTIHEDRRIVKQVDSVPYEQGGRGNWFVDRETTTLPMCSVFDDLGGYSLRSYMLQPVVTKARVTDLPGYREWRQRAVHTGGCEATAARHRA